MSEIKDIRIQPINIPGINSRQIRLPRLTTPNPPVDVPLGFPIVEMPCVVTRKAEYENSALITNDPKGNVVLCPSGYPTYNAMEFTPNEFTYAQEDQPQRYEEPEIPASDAKPPKKTEQCPPDGAPKVGTKVEDGKREIIKYELVGNRCVTRYKELTVKQQIVDAIPTVPQVIKTGSITLVATTAALSTPILLRAVKPIIKQIVNRVKKILGKKVKRPNLSEKRTNFYREKRGLPPLKAK